MKQGCPYGAHRVLKPAGVLPQTADVLDNTMELYDNELLIDVETLNIDSASFVQIAESVNRDIQGIKERMLEIVATRGKHHNPITGSGGMLIGRVKEIGPRFPHADLEVGERIASLVSLSLTPLKINDIKKVDLESGQVDVDAQAVLFASGIYAKLPDDIPDKVALAVLDVAGAPAQTARLVRPGDTVFIIGIGGKSGLLCLHEARKRAGVTGKIIGFGRGQAGIDRAASLELADVILQGDATRPVEVLEKFKKATGGQLADVTINCVNSPATEMTSILTTRDGGTVYFFSMATSFTRAALGAEGVGKDVHMIIGNGYARDHAKIALSMLRENRKLWDIFHRLYG